MRFQEWVATDVNTVREIVEGSKNVGRVVKAFGLSKNSSAMIIDAAIYFGWKPQWDYPVAGVAEFDWADPLNIMGDNQGNDVGRRMERLVTAHLDACAEALPVEHVVFHENERGLLARLYRELTNTETHVAPWDYTLWFPTERRIVFFETKAGSHSTARSKARVQLEKRQRQIETLRNAGVTVNVFVVLGGRVDQPERSRMPEIHGDGGWSGGFPDITTELLMSSTPAELINYPVPLWQIRKANGEF